MKRECWLMRTSLPTEESDAPGKVPHVYLLPLAVLLSTSTKYLYAKMASSAGVAAERPNKTLNCPTYFDPFDISRFNIIGTGGFKAVRLPSWAPK
jgi:hypothetical protein